MRYAFLATISPGYMFSLNANFNAAKHYGTQADWHISYHAAMPKEYMEACSKAFPFKIIWHPLVERNENQKYGDLYHAFFADKYFLADQIKDDYDAVCIIDADLFVCGNMTPYFDMAFETKKLITASHEHSQRTTENMFSFQMEDIYDRNMAALADFPVFFDPTFNNQFIKDWYNFTFISGQHDERSHPLIAFNRSVRKNFTLEDVVTLDGNQWVCDMNYWERLYLEHNDMTMHNYKTEMVNGEVILSNPQRVWAIHNRWWKEGRANNEIIANRNDSLYFKNAVQNFNNIRNFMAKFNAMTPETYWDDFEKMVFK